jgi:hypothetical protein
MGTPRIETDLRLNDHVLEGTVTNASDVPLSDVSLVYGESVNVLGDMAPGESRPVKLTVRTVPGFEGGLWDRLYPQIGGDPQAVRTLAARRALVQHLAGGWAAFEGSGQSPLFAQGPIVLAWQSGPTVDVDLGSATEQVGERVYVLRTHVEITGPAVFTGGLIQHATVLLDGVEASESGGLYYLTRGTITTDYWPFGFQGAFHASRLSVRLGSSPEQAATISTNQLAPLPADQQPDPDEPLASDPEPGDTSTLPRLQLFDRVAGTWIEFQPLVASRSYEIADPMRYLDTSGTIRARFVQRGLKEFAEFALGIRLEGTVE